MSDRLQPSGIRAVFDRAAVLEAEGRSIVHLEIGRPHVGSPPVAIEAARAALARGDTHYTASRGTAGLRVAIGDDLARRGAGDWSSGDEIVVTAGGSEAVAATCLALLEPGDEAIVLDPAWPHYAGHVALAGGVAKHVACRAEDGFEPDPDAVAAAIGPRTKLLIVSSPSNPTGAVIGGERLGALAALCVEHDMIALSDEIYHRFVYGDARFKSVAALPGMHERTVIADSCSKTYSMTGWRVGWAAAPAPLAARITAVHQHLSVCAPSFAQAGAETALRDAELDVAAMVGEYDARRRALEAALADSPVLEPVALRGAFYAFPRVRSGDGDAVAMALLEEAGVAVVPGSVFGAASRDRVRLSYAVAGAELDEALSRIAGWSSTSPAARNRST